MTSCDDKPNATPPPGNLVPALRASGRAKFERRIARRIIGKYVPPATAPQDADGELARERDARRRGTRPSTSRPARRLLLVEPYWHRPKDPRTPLGQASLLASLRAEAASIEVCPFAIGVNEPGSRAQVLAWIDSRIADQPADTVDVAIGTYVWAEPMVQAIIARVRGTDFAGRIILGGPQISYAGPGLERLYPGVDIFVRGPGEDALCKLAVEPDARIPGVHRAGQLDLGQQTRVDLTELPSPWTTGTIALDEQRFVRWETQRGCPYQCSFCQHREPGSRTIRRPLNADRIAEEVALFCRSGVESIAVLDPIFNIGVHGCNVLDRFIQHRYAGHLSLQCRPELINEAFIEIAAQLDVTLEFGLQTIHETESVAVDRRNDMSKAEPAIRAAINRGIAIEVSLIFGLPTQTAASFAASVQWALDVGVPTIKAFPLMMLRGTKLALERERWGLVEDDHPMPVVTGSNSFGLHDWQQMAAIAGGLRATEGGHPQQVAELERIGRTRPLDFGLWRPAT